MSDSEVEIVDVTEDELTEFNLAKLKKLRDSASFVRNVEKTYKNHMSHEKWKKLNDLANVLESNITSSEFFIKFPNEKIRKFQTVIANLMTEFKTNNAWYSFHVNAY
ncbi:uncharacterized protein LOC117781349 isoform X2 [Drosophila innubila]|uniref:uncharacterized protein LOC117781349 isoform X2 n=1 Tax=Drosophila innubila TaxID=198719 RepID=UPI00148E3626|nr:uncharacterized protein LOC117781349 isoform X2 [Drosophila innubila]